MKGDILEKSNIMNVMKLQTKLMLPITLVMIVSFVLLEGLVSNQIYNGLTMDLIQSQMEGQLDNLTKSFEARKEVKELVFETVSEEKIRLAKSLATMIEQDPSIMNARRLERVARQLGVDEIHITDAKGVIQYGTLPEFYGFDFATSEQTKEFLPLLSSKDGAIAQLPAKRGTDNKLFQYIGVSRLGEQGIIQIGLEPTYLEELEKSISLQGLIEELKIGENGYSYVVDTDGTMIYHKKPSSVNINIDTMEELKPLDDESINFFHYMIDGEKVFAAVRRVDGIRYVAAMPESDFKDDINKLSSTMIILFAIILAVINIATMFIARRVFRPIAAMVQNMKKAGEGDLTVQMQVQSKDELGKLSESFNHMVTNVGGLISNAKGVSMEVASASENLAASAQETSASTDEMARTVEEIAKGATEQASDTDVAATLTSTFDKKLNHLKDNSHHISVNADEVQNINKNGTKTLQDLKDATDNNIVSANEITKAVQELEEKSDSIGSILLTISSIADQTNLLALNASIEAARAGEHGKGFAVVADEIRKLAEESSASAEKIADIVKIIQSKTASAVEIVAEVKENADVQSMSVDNMNERFVEISKAIEEISKQIYSADTFIVEVLEDKDNIVNAISSISAVSEETAASSEEVSATAEQQSIAIEGVAASADQLNQLAANLNMEISKFKISKN